MNSEQEFELFSVYGEGFELFSVCGEELNNIGLIDGRCIKKMYEKINEYMKKNSNNKYPILFFLKDKLNNVIPNDISILWIFLGSDIQNENLFDLLPNSLTCIYYFGRPLKKITVPIGVTKIYFRPRIDIKNIKLPWDCKIFYI
jgi:hypothetical protein